MLFRFETLHEALDLLDILRNQIDKKGYVTIGYSERLIGEVNCSTKTYARTYGWIDLEDAYVEKIDDDHYVCMPQPIKLTYADIENHKKENDLVNHPQHYKSKSGLEVIDAIKAFTEDLQGIEAVDTANIIKYICRWKKKNGLQDLEKAQWYLNNLIEYVKENENEDVK